MLLRQYHYFSQSLGLHCVPTLIKRQAVRSKVQQQTSELMHSKLWLQLWVALWSQKPKNFRIVGYLKKCILSTSQKSSSQSYGFSSSHVWMWELDYKENWVPKNWCFWTVVLENTLESPLVSKEIQPVHSKGNQSWIAIGRTDAEAETPILSPPDAKSWLTGKDHDAGKDWRWEEKGMTEDETVGWHHWLSGLSLSKFWDLVMNREAWHTAVHGSPGAGHNWLAEQDWATELNWTDEAHIRDGIP